MPVPRDIAVRFLVTRDDISKAMKDQQEAAKRTKQQVDAIAGGFDSLTNAQRRGLRDWIQLTNGPREMAKAQQRMLEIQLRYNAAIAQARTLTDRAARNAAIVAAVNARNMQQELSARVLAEQRILDMERRRRIGTGGAGGFDWRTAAAGMHAYGKAADGVSGILNDLSMKMFVLTFAARQMVETLLHTFVQVGEKVELTRFKLEGLTGSTRVFGAAFNVAQELGVGLDTVTGALTRFAVVNKSVGMTNQELVQMTRNIAALGLIGGSGVQELQAGMIQLAQGFASNRLQGDEFRSVLENIPMVAVKMAEAFKVDIAGLRAMSTEGKITADMMKKAFLSMTKEIDAMLMNIPQTSEMALNRLSNSWSIFINEMLRATGMEAAGEAIGGLTAEVTKWGNWVSTHQGETAVWVETLKDVGVAALLATGSLIGLRTAVGVLGTLGVAFAAINKALGVYAFSMMSAATASARFGAAATLAAAGVRTLIMTLGPIIAVLGAAVYAWQKYNDNQRAAREEAQKTRDSLEEMATALENVTRNQLINRQRLVTAAIEDTITKIGEAARQIQQLEQQSKQQQVVYDPVSGEFQIADQTTAQRKEALDQLIALRAQMDGYIQDLEREGTAQKKLSDALEERNKQGAAMVASSAATISVIKEMGVGTERLTEKLRNATTELRLITQFGLEQGGYQARRAMAADAYAQRMKAILGDPKTGVNGSERSAAAISMRNDQIETAQKELRLSWDLVAAEQRLSEVRAQNRESKRDAESSLQVIKAITAGSKVSEANIQTYTQRLEQYKEYFEQASKTYGVPIALLRSMAFQESGFNMGAVSPAGARGVMQFMPKTAGMVGRQMGVDPQAILSDAQTNILAGAKYIADLAKQLGSWEAALGWYNGGKRGAGPNPAAETVGYKRNILASWQRQGGVEGDPEQAARAERDLYQKNADSFADSRMRMLETQRGYTAQVMVELERYRQANLQVDRDVELSDAAKNMAREANLEQFNTRTASLMQERQVQEQEYRAETQALLDSTLSDQQRKEAETAAQILEIRRQQAESDGVITQRMMDERIAAIERVAKSEQLNEMATSIGQAFGEAFGSLAKGGETASETMQRLLEALRDTVVQLLIIKPIAEMVANAINSIGTGGKGGGAGSLLGAFIGGSVRSGAGASFATAGSGALLGSGSAAASAFLFARGGYINGLAHGVYSSPTMFPMAGPGFHAFAKGTGLLGEAGPEAVMPLRRGPDGRLGVGGNAPNVTINNYTDGQVKTSVGDDGKLTIDIIRNTLARDILHGGNTLSRAMDTARARRG